MRRCHPCHSEKRQRTRTGRGAHARIQRNGRGPDAGVAVSPIRGNMPAAHGESCGPLVWLQWHGLSGPIVAQAWGMVACSPKGISRTVL
eukprot:gene9612-biopygen21248